MAIKTKETNESVNDFIDAIDNDQKKKDCKELLKLMKKVSGHKPKLWSNGTIGFEPFIISLRKANKKVIGIQPDLPHEKPISPFTFLPINNLRCLKNWVKLKQGAVVCTLINLQISTQKYWRK